MADTKISALTAATTLADTDELVIASSGASKKITGANLKASIPGTGGGGIGAVLFNSTVTGSDATSIDSGAAGIAGGYKILQIFLVSRTDDASVRGDLLVVLNNDTGTNYDYIESTAIVGTGVSAGGSSGDYGGLYLATTGGSAAANKFGIARLTVPFYTETAAHKIIESTNGYLKDQTGNPNGYVAKTTLGVWRNTAAITRIAVFPQTGGKKLKVGSHLTVFGF